MAQSCDNMSLLILLLLSGRSLLLFVFLCALSLLWSQCSLEVSIAVVDQNIVPQQQFLDVTVVNTILVKLGQHFLEICAELLADTFL